MPRPMPLTPATANRLLLFSAGPPWYRTTFWTMTTWIMPSHHHLHHRRPHLTANHALRAHFGLHPPRPGLATHPPFQFLHAGPFHLALSMLWALFLGPLVRMALGQGGFLLFYCSAASPVGALSSPMVSPRSLIGQDSLLVRRIRRIFGVMGRGR